MIFSSKSKKALIFSLTYLVLYFLFCYTYEESGIGRELFNRIMYVVFFIPFSSEMLIGLSGHALNENNILLIRFLIYLSTGVISFLFFMFILTIKQKRKEKKHKISIRN
jgi:hypothetical protein